MVMDVLTTSVVLRRTNLYGISLHLFGMHPNHFLNGVDMFPKQLTGYLMFLRQLLKLLSEVRIPPSSLSHSSEPSPSLGSNMIFTLAASIVRDTKAFDGTPPRI
jgi:hypothetical protein